MKNIFYSLLMITVVLGGYSCQDESFLSETVTTELDREKVFSDSTLTEGFLMEIYRNIGFDVRGNRFTKDDQVMGGLQTACDEAEYRTSPKVSADVQFATGTINPVVITDDAWKIPYENIRKVNVFLKYIEKAPLEAGIKNARKAEARFLRAWYYAILMKHYGGVPLIGDNVYNENDSIKGTRNTYDECLQYIVQECEAVKSQLVLRPERSEYGRAGGGACLALIARMKLYAASPLFNGNSAMVAGTNFPPELIGYPEAKASRWEEALKAAEDVINTNSYKLYESHNNAKAGGVSEPGYGFYAVFVASDDNNNKQEAFKEIIIDDRSQGRVAREGWFQPPTRSGTTKSGFAYQNLVDAFPMNNGLPIDDPNSGYDPNDPYRNRDPRLRNTVLCDGDSIAEGTANALKIVDIYIENSGLAKSKDAVHRGTPTGYYINKMVNRYYAANAVHGYPEQIPLIRYAEILLIYAEAMNEVNISTGGEGAIVPASEKTYEVLKTLRRRGGIDIGNDPQNSGQMFGLKAGMTRLEMRKAIQLERRLELAVEGHRFFDVRRWKIADKTDNELMSGMEVRLKADGIGKTYTKFEVRRRVFRNAMYFWPIPYGETIKSPNLLQNPYYN